MEIETVDCSEQCASGMGMLPDEVAEAEKAVSSAPEDIAPRVKLIGYYHTKITFREEQVRRDAHIHWLIDNRPEVRLGACGNISPYVSLHGYEEAKRRWLAAVAGQPENPRILGNASLFLFMGDPAIAKELIVRGIAISPSAEWHETMAAIYKASSRSPTTLTEKYELDTMIIAECERALSLVESASGRYRLCVEIAVAAADSWNASKASDSALYVLEAAKDVDAAADPSRGVHWANIVLGKVAMMTNDIPRARRHLIAAGATSAEFSNFELEQPDLSLASALLERGENDAVAQYLLALEESWNENVALVSSWRGRIERGESVDLDEFRRTEQARKEEMEAWLRSRSGQPT